MAVLDTYNHCAHSYTYDNPHSVAAQFPQKAQAPQELPFFHTPFPVLSPVPFFLPFPFKIQIITIFFNGWLQNHPFLLYNVP